MKNQDSSRRRFLCGAVTSMSAMALYQAAPRWAVAQGNTEFQTNNNEVNLKISQQTFSFGNKKNNTITINGQMPGPLLRFREGERAIINVSNALSEDTSIHWHGIILPANMDGVPGLSFAGIKPGETFRYEFDLQQSGTYWYHSHSGLQEQIGHLGPLVIHPADGNIGADREHMILLSDWTFEDPHDIFRKLKVSEGYYNYQKRTIFDTLKDVEEQGLADTWHVRSMWNSMRMDPRDIADVSASAYTYLMNGRDAVMNWEALFNPGEKVRLRLVNGSAMTYFDFRIPGLEMTVVAADGQPVKPVTVDEIRIAIAESYDVIVQPKENKAYTLFAESYDRSGFVRGTLAPRPGMSAAVPPRRTITERGMDAMSMDHGDMDHSSMSHDDTGHGSMGHSGMNHAAMNHPPAETSASGATTPGDHSSMDHSQMSHGNMDHSAMNHGGHEMQGSGKPAVDDIAIHHDPDGHGPGAAMIAANPRSRLDEPGIGLGNDGRRVLVYKDLTGAQTWGDEREPSRNLELHLTGNMQRYMWSFDGKKFSEVDGPVVFRHGERLRLVLVNDTMMDHPIHLHGMWMELENGQYPRPRKHTISLKPSEKVSLLITADAMGDWAFHCHLLYHMEAGMFRVVSVQHGGHHHG